MAFLPISNINDVNIYLLPQTISVIFNFQIKVGIIKETGFNKDVILVHVVGPGVGYMSWGIG